MMTTRAIGEFGNRPGIVRALLAGCAVVVACGVGVNAATAAADEARVPTLQGFATDASVGRGETVRFKIETDAPAYSVTIYRIDESGAAGTELVAVLPNPPAPQVQPPCIPSQDGGPVDCSNWAESASWKVPADAPPGIYVAMLSRPDTNASSQIVFVIQEDGGI